MGRQRPRPRNNFVDRDVREVPVFIYGLADPGSRKLRYIGRSQDPRKRVSGHASSCQSYRVFTWLRGLREEGKGPELVILHVVQPGEDASLVELAAIRQAEADGHPLLNYFGLVNPPPKINSKKPDDLVRESARFGDSYARMRVRGWKRSA